MTKKSLYCLERITKKKRKCKRLLRNFKHTKLFYLQGNTTKSEANRKILIHNITETPILKLISN